MKNQTLTSQKTGTLFILESIMIVSFILIMLAFVVPSTTVAINMILVGIVSACIGSVAILFGAEDKIGVERGLFKQNAYVQA